MVWARLDDQFPDHPKVAPLSDLAFRVHVAGICYAARYLTDGFVPEGEVPRLVRAYKPKVARELVDARLWRPVEGGFQVAGFLDYNPSKEKVEADREAAAERKRKWAEKKAAEKAANAARNASRDASRTLPRPIPDPTRPEGPWVGSTGERSVVLAETDDAEGVKRPDTSLAPEQVELNVSHLRSLRGGLREGKAS